MIKQAPMNKVVERKPGRTKLEYNKKTKTIKKVRINFWKCLLWDLKNK